MYSLVLYWPTSKSCYFVFASIQIILDQDFGRTEAVIKNKQYVSSKLCYS